MVCLLYVDYISLLAFGPVDRAVSIVPKNPCMKLYKYICIYRIFTHPLMAIAMHMANVALYMHPSKIGNNCIRDPLVRTRHIRLNKLLVEHRRLYGGMAF